MRGFEWDERKNEENFRKHGVTFEAAQLAFLDPDRLTEVDEKHSTTRETRYFLYGRVEQGILTVRFTYRRERIRIIGAGFWRRGRTRYEGQRPC